jgi:predicted AAA+ superfamily ATPase
MYITRRLEGVIKSSLFQGKVIVVYGARQVGKTTMVKKIAEDLGEDFSYLNCDELDVLTRLENAENSQALKLVIGDKRIVIIDEAQRVKNIGLKLKLLVDNFPGLQIIATGSSSFDLANEIQEPLTGRNYEFWLFPLGLNELFTKDQLIEADRQLESLLIYGSYPDVYPLDSNDLKSQRIKYLASNYLYQDVLKFNGVKNSDTIIKLIQALALQIGNEVSYNELANLIGVGKETVAQYINLLEKAFIIFHLPPYSGNLRKAIGKMRKIYFIDLGIRNAIINNQNPLHLRDDVGKLWENFIIAEKYKQQLGLGFKTDYYFWRTYDKQEVDLVENKEGYLRGWEIKWTAKEINPPSAWKAYPNSTWQLITKENYLSKLLEGSDKDY